MTRWVRGFILALGFIVAAGSFAEADETAASVVAAIYAVATKTPSKPAIQNKALRERVFTRSFRAVLVSIDARETGTGEAVLDFDPILSMNGDGSVDKLVIKTLREDATVASVVATFGTGADRRSVAYTLRLEDGAWRVDDIGAPATKAQEAWSVREISDSDLAARAAPAPSK